MKKHTVILSDYSRKPESPSLGVIRQYSKCLIALPVFYDNVSVICNDDLLTKKVSHILANAPHMANKNNKLVSLFAIDDHIFMIVSTDRPVVNSHQWIPYYAQYVSGFFVFCHRHSTSYIFDNCGVPVFPLSGIQEPNMSLLDFERDTHSKSMTITKDISVFFRGRYNTRLPRKFLARQIQEHITNAHISNSGDHKSLPTQDYVDLMCRSKIAWCPRSVKSPPDFECNASTGREFEAMCLECLVVRPSIGTIETEERVPGVHFVEIKNDSSDLIEKLRYYLEHEDERKEIAHNGRLWWERNCSTIARANQIYSDCLKATGATQ